jgi:SAM-dependent methyltransferase
MKESWGIFGLKNSLDKLGHIMTTLLEEPLYQSTRHAWENIWDTANVEAELATMRYPRTQYALNNYLPYLNKDDLILEAGSGLSAAVITLRTLGYRIMGLDYALNALQASRAYDDNLALMGGDVHALPLADHSLGAYLSFGVLEHFPHGMTPALHEAYRVLKTGGVLVLTIPYPNVVWKLAQWRRAQQGQARIDADFYESTHTRESLVAHCTGVGFDVVRTIPLSHDFTLWGAHRVFRGEGYYQTSPLADTLGGVLRVVAPWAFNFMTLVIARK